MNCPICDRVLDDTADEHHLIPKTFKGKEKINLHRICHDAIHTTFTERELAKYYHTVERVRAHPNIIKFVQWVKNKPIDYFVKSKDTRGRKEKRRK